MADWELLGGEFVIIINFWFFKSWAWELFSNSFVVFAGRVVSSTLLLFHGANAVWIWWEGRLQQLHTVHLATVFTLVLLITLVVFILKILQCIRSYL